MIKTAEQIAWEKATPAQRQAHTEAMRDAAYQAAIGVYNRGGSDAEAEAAAREAIAKVPDFSL